MEEAIKSVNGARRIIIAGGPRTGKTRLARRLAAESGITVVRHTDDLNADHDWSAASLAASLWFDWAGAFVVEGVAAVRAIRKWLAANLEGTPADLVIWLGNPAEARTKGQESMAKGCATVWKEILPLLVDRGVAIQTDGAAA